MICATETHFSLLDEMVSMHRWQMSLSEISLLNILTNRIGQNALVIV